MYPWKILNNLSNMLHVFNLTRKIALMACRVVRCVLTKKGAAHVFFIDYGNSERVRMSSARPLAGPAAAATLAAVKLLATPAALAYVHVPDLSNALHGKATVGVRGVLTVRRRCRRRGEMRRLSSTSASSRTAPGTTLPAS